MVTSFFTHNAEKLIFSKNTDFIITEILILMSILMFISSRYSINQYTTLCFTILHEKNWK